MDLVIIGAGGHGRDCHQLILDLQEDGAARFRGTGYNLIGYLDENPELAGTEVQGLPVLGGLDWLEGRSVGAVLGIGYPKPRRAVQQRAAALGVREWPSFIHPTAYRSPRADIGLGVTAFPLSHIGNNARIGDFAALNVGGMVGHDCGIGRYSHVTGGAVLAGGVALGEGVLVGLGASVAPGVSIGDWTQVNVGSAVVCDLPAHVVASGNPARPRREVDPPAPAPAQASD